MSKEAVIEAPVPENLDGTPESVFEKLHIADKFLKLYVENPKGLHPEQKTEIERHIANVCPGECQQKIDELVREIQENDPKVSQLPERDR